MAKPKKDNTGSKGAIKAKVRPPCARAVSWAYVWGGPPRLLLYTVLETPPHCNYAALIVLGDGPGQGRR